MSSSAVAASRPPSPSSSAVLCRGARMRMQSTSLALQRRRGRIELDAMTGPVDGIVTGDGGDGVPVGHVERQRLRRRCGNTGRFLLPRRRRYRASRRSPLDVDFQRLAGEIARLQVLGRENFVIVWPCLVPFRFRLGRDVGLVPEGGARGHGQSVIMVPVTATPHHPGRPRPRENRGDYRQVFAPTRARAAYLPGRATTGI